MTEISRNSWHYRWIRRMGFYPERSRSICGYFWKLGLVSWIPLLLAVAYVTVNVRFPFVFQLTATVVIAMIVVLLVGALGIAAIFAIMLGGHTLLFRTKDVGYGKETRPFIVQPLSAANVVFEYIGAKKKGVCPLISYTND